MGRVKQGHATAKCGKGYAKLKVVVKEKGGDPVEKASVLVQANGKRGKCTLKTNAEGAVIFTVKAGSYDATASADNAGAGQAPALPFSQNAVPGMVLEAEEEKDIQIELDAVAETVTPHIEAPVVSVHCPAEKEDQNDPDDEVEPTAIEVYLEHSIEHSGYSGGAKLTIPADLEVFSDKKCSEALQDGELLSHGELTAKKRKKLYLRGKKEGKQTLELTLEDAEHDSITLADPAKQEFDVKQVVLLKPKLEVEYLVVQLDRNLNSSLVRGEAKVKTDATVALVSLSQSKDDPVYDKGVLLEIEPKGAIEVFSDEDLTQKLDLKQAIPYAEVTGDEPKKVFLKGAKKGRFTLRAKVEEASKANDRSPDFKAGKPSEQKMAVVELVLGVHQQDRTELGKVQVATNVAIDTYYTNLRDKVLPEQKKLSDKDKVKQGRILHEQDSGHFGRAKLLIEELSADDWPEEGCDGYELVINEDNVSGELEVFDAEEGGNAQAFPIKLKVSDLLNGEKVLWVEGKTLTNKEREAKLDLGLDRPDGGVAKTPKRRGDWARFTVLKIASLELDYVAPNGKASAWDDAQERFYINLQSSPTGRKVKFKAKLAKKIKGVEIHFMLSPDGDNRKAANWGVALPAAWTWQDIGSSAKRKDKNKPKDLLHLSAKTDAEGEASCELVLSQFGGDVFHPAAYLSASDPHLAKFFHGHADLGTRKPVLAANKIIVWRKIWFQKVAVEGLAPPALGPAVAQWERVKVEAIQAADLAVSRATVDGYNPIAIYPRYMIEVNGGNADALVVSDKNKGQFFSGFSKEDDKPNKIPILVCDAQWDPEGKVTWANIADIPNANFPVTLDTGSPVLSPPLQGGDLASGKWEAWDWNAAANDWENKRSGTLGANDVTIDPTRDKKTKISVRRPAGLTDANATTHVTLTNLKVKVAGSYLGESFKKRILAVYNPTQAADFQNTIVHEMGHAYDQVNHKGPAKGIPKHPVQVDLGQGNHCHHLTNKCVMYDSGPIVGSLNRFCDVCHPYLLAQDMTKIK